MEIKMIYNADIRELEKAEEIINHEKGIIAFWLLPDGKVMFKFISYYPSSPSCILVFEAAEMAKFAAILRENF